MSKLGVTRLAEAWSAAQSAYERGEIDSRQWKTIFAVQRLVDRDATLLWELIVDVLSLAPPPEVLEILAAGPLEDLIRNHGAEALSRIEKLAGEDTQFRELLRGVWISTPVDQVTKRYEELGCTVRSSGSSDS